ncbi:MAG: DEAD/DEAH box helicase family protein [Myxococcota bacterium]
MTGWNGITAGAPLRAYQARAVERLVEQLAEAGSRACLVAPPGSGKTRTALHVAATLQRPVNVRVPTLALVQQWNDQIATTLVDLDDSGGPAPIEVTTYAADAPLAERGLLVLDEAHHVGGTWGSWLLDRLTPAHRVLGLTATPPMNGPKLRGFERLVGTAPIEIETPPLVREGALSPYQDLVWPVLCDPEEAGEAQEAWRTLDETRRMLGARLDAFVSVQLREDFLTLTEARFRHEDGLLVALCRIRHASGEPLPNDLPIDPELVAEPTLADWATVLWASGDERARKTVRDLGFRAASGEGVRLILDRDRTFAGLAASRARVRGCIEVLDLEHRHRGDQVRALILTERDVASDDDRASARSILRELVADPRSDALDPVLVTGKALWVDDDLLPKIRPRFPDVAHRRVGGHHELDVSGWSTADRVAQVTELFRGGWTRCVVGTRHLLGEGWDCPAVNVVIDLTGIRAFVTVHQVRGRGLRLDPADPSKVTSLWDVPVLVPGLPGGDRMIERLRERHGHTFGVDDEGRVRRGLARIDPALNGSAGELAAALPEVQTRMRARLDDSAGVVERWAVGSDYRDALVFVVEPSPHPEPGPEDPEEGPLADTVLRSPLVPAVVHERPPEFPTAQVASAGAAAAIGGAVMGEGLLAGMLGLSVAVSMGAVFFLPWWRAKQAWDTRIERWEAERAPPVLGRARSVFDALVARGAVKGTLREDGHRVWLEGPIEDSQRFARAVRELEGPVTYPRYLLLARDQGRTTVWPVPTVLGADKGKARALAEAWVVHCSPCEVVYARQGRGRGLLEAAWRQAPRTAPAVEAVWA